MSDPARIRNIFQTGNLTRRKGQKIQAVTRFGRVEEGPEQQPYGFAARAKKGKVFFYYEGGDVRSCSMAAVCDQEGVPDLKDGDSALWTSAGGWVICRDDGAVELFGKEFGGLIKVEELRSQLEKITAFLAAVKNACQVQVVEPGLGAPSAFQVALKAALATQVAADFSEIENKKVLHGNG